MPTPRPGAELLRVTQLGTPPDHPATYMVSWSPVHLQWEVRTGSRTRCEQQSFPAVMWWCDFPCSLTMREKLGGGECSSHDWFNNYPFLCSSVDLISFPKGHRDVCEFARVCVYLVAALIVATRYPSLCSFQLSLWLVLHKLLSSFSNSFLFSIGEIFKIVFLLSLL